MVAKADPLKELIDQGLVPKEPEIPEGGVLVLVLQRTYGPAPDGRTYTSAVIGRREALFPTQVWTATGKSPQTPENATWAQFISWLMAPKKSKWKLVMATGFSELGNSKALNHQLYRSGK